MRVVASQLHAITQRTTAPITGGRGVTSAHQKISSATEVAPWTRGRGPGGSMHVGQRVMMQQSRPVEPASTLPAVYAKVPTWVQLK